MAQVMCLPGALRAESEAILEVVAVTATAIEGGAGGTIGVESYFDTQDIEALGAGTLEELLEELAPDVASSRDRHAGQPIVLLNGRRIASFREIHRYPPEAVQRIEVFPEEVALRYGYRANQKVVNILLVPAFRATVFNTHTQNPSGGDGRSVRGGANHLRLNEDQRWSVDISAEHAQHILESDRSVPVRNQSIPFSLAGNLRAANTAELDAALSALAGFPVTSATLPNNAGSVPLELHALVATANKPEQFNAQKFRSLTPEQENFSIGTSYSKPLGEQLLATVSASYERAKDKTLLGLPSYTLTISGDNSFSPFAQAVILDRITGQFGPLARIQQRDAYAINGSLAGTQRGWTWSWLNNMTLTHRDTETDRRAAVATLDAGDNPFAELEERLTLQTDLQKSENRDYDTRLLANGIFGSLPHGPVSAALTGAFSRNEQHNDSTGRLSPSSSKLTRNLSQLRASIDLPLFESDSGSSLSANLNSELSHYSDFDQISVWGAGLNWRPIAQIQMQTSYALEEGAPSIAELGDPLVRTPNQTVYDFVNNESASVTRITGGNSNLKPEKSEVWRVGLQFSPLQDTKLNLNLNWTYRDTTNPIDSFPQPSQEIESAFPDRFQRNASDGLLAFDTRPINLDAQQSSIANWGLAYSTSFTTKPRNGNSDHKNKSTHFRAAANQEAKRVRRITRHKHRGQGGRLRFKLNHKWILQDDLEIAPRLGTIDYVGHTGGSRGRGGAEHVITARLGYFNKGRGIRLGFQWQSATTSLPNTNGVADLKFSTLATLDLTAFYAFKSGSNIPERLAWLDGWRVRLDFENIFNDKLNVRDRNGKVPAGRSGDELDPLGRTISLRLRKILR